MRKLVKLPTISNVVAGGTCNLDIPCGLTYDLLLLTLTNITLAQLTNVELRVNGKAIQEFATGTELDDINEYHGRRAFTNGVLPIFFIRPELKLPSEQRLTALGTKNVDTFSFHADIDAACVSPAMTIHAQKSAAEDLGLITKIRAFPRAAATSGEFEISNIPKVGRIACVHFFKSDVSEVLAKVDGRETIDATKTILEELQSGMGKTPITAACTHVDYIVNGLIEDALILTGVQDLSFRPTLDSSGALRTVVEYLDGFQGV